MPEVTPRAADRNTVLMRAMGSKTGQWDPEPPDQWRYTMNHGTPREQIVAWVKSKTTANGRNSPFAIDEHGKPLYLQHMAVDLGWTLKRTQDRACDVQNEGLIRLEKGRRIWLCADVPKARASSTKQVKEDGSAFVQENWQTYLIDYIRTLPEETQASFRDKWKHKEEWSREVIADAIGAARSLIEQVEDNIYREFGLPKKRMPKRRPAEPKYVQLSLLAPPDFVQEKAVETASLAQMPISNVQTAEPPCVQSAHPLSLQTQTQTTTTTEPATLSEVAAALRRHGAVVVVKTVGELVSNCQRKSRGATLAEIIAVIDKVGRGIHAGTKNPTGVLLTQVPLVLASLRAESATAEAAHAEYQRKQAEESTRETAYSEYVEREVEHFLTHRLPAAEYDHLIAEAGKQLARQHARTYELMTPDQKTKMATNYMRAELKTSGRVPLLSFDEWRQQKASHA